MPVQREPPVHKNDEEENDRVEKTNGLDWKGKTLPSSRRMVLKDIDPQIFNVFHFILFIYFDIYDHATVVVTSHITGGPYMSMQHG